MAVSLASYSRLVRGNRNFRRLWFAQIISELGDWIYVIALYSLLLEKTGRAESIALALVLQVLPQAFVAPIAGMINDRVSRRRVMIFADLARAVIVGGMLLAGRAGSAPAIYALLVLETFMLALFEPGRSAIVPNIVAKDELVAANALSSITWSVNFALGAGLGGFIAAFLGRDTVFVLNALSFLLSAVFVRGMRFDEPHVDRSKPLRVRDLLDFSPTAEGLRYVARDRRLLSLLLVKGGLGFGGANWVILPIFGERIFPIAAGGIDPRRGALLGMSFLMSARGVGALLGPYFGGRWAGQDGARQRTGILIGFMFGFIGYLALAFAPSLWAAIAAVIFAHAGGSIVWVFSTTLLQAHTDDRFRGRVFSADFACMVVGMSTTTYVAGLILDAGVQVRAVAAAVGVLALVPALGWSYARRWWQGKP